MNVLAIIQARTGSSRLPKKVLMELGGKTILEQVVDRVGQSKHIDDILVATTINKDDLEIVFICAQKGIRVFCGSETDVLDRYYQAARLLKPLHIVRITADCPLLDPDIIDKVISVHLKKNADYTSNVIEPTYPDGLDVEIVKFSILEESWRDATLSSHREHVTQFILNSTKYKKVSIKNDIDYSNERWTIDNIKDYQFLQQIYKHLVNKKHDFKAILSLLDHKPEIRLINNEFERNEGLKKSLSEDYDIKK